MAEGIVSRYPEQRLFAVEAAGSITLDNLVRTIQDPIETLRQAMPPSCEVCIPAQQIQVQKIGQWCNDPRIGGIQRGVAMILADYGCKHM